MELALQGHLVGAEFFGLEVVVRSPASRPVLGEVEVHLRRQIVARRNSNERRPRNAAVYWPRVTGLRPRLIDALLVKDWIRQQRQALLSDKVLVDYDAVARGRPLAMRAVRQIQLPALGRRDGVLRLSGGDSRNWSRRHAR